MYREHSTQKGADEMNRGTPPSHPDCDVVVYEAPDGKARVDVRLDRETVWLTRQQMAELFGRDRSVVTRHIRNVFREGELDPEATCARFAQVQSEGGRTVSRELDHFDLDVIISVGYRVESRRGAWFRQWATRTLRNQALVDDTGRTVLELVTGYADTWRLLLEYDEDRLAAPRDARPSVGVLDHDRATGAITAFKRELMARDEASPLFGHPRGDALESILGNVEQTMFGEPLYRSREEKAANLLYFVVKDHPFTDGNKRIGSLLFLLYLKQEGVEHGLNPQALTALTLLIAESAPAAKDLMIRLVVNLLSERAG